MGLMKDNCFETRLWATALSSAGVSNDVPLNKLRRL